MNIQTPSVLLFVGTYTTRGSQGLYSGRFDPATGAISDLAPDATMPNPTFQVLHPTLRVLYSVSEMRDEAGRHDGSVTAFAIDLRTGRLTALNRQTVRAQGPCHLAVDATGRMLIASNYASGSVTALPIAPDGRLREPASVIQHHGSSVVAERQSEPHAHSTTISPDNRFAFAADLGIDRVVAYRTDPAAATLAAHDSSTIAVRPGLGPRHFAFHPSRRSAYLITELGNTINVFSYDEASGRLSEIQEISTLPDGHAGVSYAADVHLSADGRFLYGSNRGHDSIAIFAVDPDSGRLTAAGHAPVRGKWPRNFALDRAGRYLIAANQESDSLTVFGRDPDTGQLEPHGAPVAVPAPVCVTLMPTK